MAPGAVIDALRDLEKHHEVLGAKVERALRSAEAKAAVDADIALGVLPCMALALLMRALGLDRRGRLVAIASPQQDFLAIRWDGYMGNGRSWCRTRRSPCGPPYKSHHTLDALERIGEASSGCTVMKIAAGISLGR